MSLGHAGRFQKNPNLLVANSNGYSFTNLNSDSIVRSKISFSMWAKMIKISINENFIEGDNGIEWNPTSAANIFLGYDKAMQLLHLLKEYKEDRTRGLTENVIESGKSLIGIYNGAYFNKGEDITVIRIVQFTDDTKTNISKQAAYQLGNGAYYGTVDEDSMKVSYTDEHIYSDKELDLIIIQLSTYVNAMANSFAYANAENESYNDSMLRLYLKGVLQKLGCAVPSNLNGGVVQSSNNRYSGQNFENVSDYK